MYEKKFELSRPLFRALASGADVFVGPQTAKIMASMKKALTSTDAVIALTGEPGVGKSTLAGRGIDAIAGDKLVIRVARMQLGHDEVIEFLLDKLGAEEIPASTIKKINLCRDLLAKQSAAGSRVLISIEDAVRIGEDALAEFESLTAADSDHAAGANIILMGDDSLLQILKSPALRRLHQRTRLRQPVLPLAAGELLGYMKHFFRLAGGEFDLVFEDGAGQTLFDASKGNPRVANNLVEAVLTAATEQKASKVDAAIIARVAGEEFGLTISVPALESAPEAEPETVSDPEPVPVAAAEPETDIPELIQDTLPDLEVLAPGLAAQGLVISTESEPPAADDDEDEIPTLFSTSQLNAPKPTPNAAAAEPEPAAAPEPPPVAKAPAPTATPEPAPVAKAPAPTATPEPAPVAKAPEPAATPEPAPVAKAPEPAAAEPQAEWDRDPTFAELRPDIEALEQAMADFQQDEEEPDDGEDEPLPDVVLKDPTLPGVPHLTLDFAIEKKVQEVQEALQKTDADIPADAVPVNTAANAAAPKVGVPPLVNPTPPAANDQKADAELEKIAVGLASAKSLEDVDDHMAETLFGEEFSLIAAQVAAHASGLGNPDVELATGENPGAKPAPHENAQAPTAEEEFKAVYGEDAHEVSMETGAGGGLDLSATQRLATVRALNADKAPKADAPVPPGATTDGANGAAPNAQQPQPIEDQINTSMTQTLKALGTRPKPSVVDDDDDEDSKGGFFSRFKRS